MTDLETLYERNAAFAAHFEHGDLPIKPRFDTIILTCVDARLSPASIVGLELGDALTLRNVGARVTSAVGVEVALLWQLMELMGNSEPNLEVAIIEHTACGMNRIAMPEVAEMVTARFGTPVVADTYGIADHRSSLEADVGRLRADERVPRQLRVSGHLYDVATGVLTEIVPSQPLG